MRDTNRSRLDKRHSQEDFVGACHIQKEEGTNIVILFSFAYSRLHSLLRPRDRICRYDTRTGYSNPTSTIYDLQSCFENILESEFSNESRNRIVNLGVSYAPTESSVVSQDLRRNEVGVQRNFLLFTFSNAIVKVVNYFCHLRARLASLIVSFIAFFPPRMFQCVKLRRFSPARHTLTLINSNSACRRRH